MQFHPGFTYECFYYQQSEEGNKAFPRSTHMTLQQPAATLTGVGTALCHLYHTGNAPGAMAAGCLWPAMGLAHSLHSRSASSAILGSHLEAAKHELEIGTYGPRLRSGQSHSGAS